MTDVSPASVPSWQELALGWPVALWLRRFDAGLGGRFLDVDGWSQGLETPIVSPSHPNDHAASTMFPLHDDNPTELFPFVTLALMAACIGVWVLVQGGGLVEERLASSICILGAIPAELTHADVAPGACLLGGLRTETIISSMFLHGGWMHLIGNLWFLWIFGNNVEDSMGHIRFLFFYLVCGVLALGLHVGLSPDSVVPLVGASGAISGVMGAYLVLYPRVKISTFFLVFVVKISAWVMLGYWFFLQLIASVMQNPMNGGVAFGAHVGGFVAGVVLIKIFRDPTLVRAKHEGVKISRSELRFRGWI